MVWWWWILPGVVAVFGLAVLLSGLGWIFRGRPFKGGRGIFGGGVVLAVGGLIGLLGLNIQTYHRLTFERPVAEITLARNGPQDFTATLKQPDGTQQDYRLHGDQWRIEARVLKWKPWANVLGLDSQYRLDRLSGRYETVEDELNAERSAYQILPTRSTGIDLWPLARQFSQYAPVVDTLYGSGAYMPMADGARYEVRITQSGLVARPLNDRAFEASATGWQ